MGEAEHSDRETLADVPATVADHGDPSACTVERPTTGRSRGDQPRPRPRPAMTRRPAADGPRPPRTRRGRTRAPVMPASRREPSRPSARRPTPRRRPWTAGGTPVRLELRVAPRERPWPSAPLRPSPAMRSWASWAAAAWASSTRPARSGSTAPVALKMILAGAHAGAEAAARFLAEAEAVARLQHPNIVQIYHIGEHDGLPFFELEYVAGGSLAGSSTAPPGRRGEAARLVETLARRHGRGAPAGDRPPRPQAGQRPADAPTGAPKVTDFGLAKALDVESGLTRTESILGSPSYMAPEQAEGKTKAGRPGGRRLRAGGDPLRAADRPAAVPGRDGAGDARAGQDGRAGAAVAAGAGPAARPGDDLPEVPAEGAGPAVRIGRRRWPRTCGGSRRASRSVARPVGGRRSGPGGGAGETRRWRA